MKEGAFQKIGAVLRQDKKAFCQNPKSWMRQCGANLAGCFWNTGNGLQFLLGAVALSPRIVISSILNVSSASSTMIFGQKDWGVVANAVLGTIGTGIFLYPSLIHGDVGTIVGYAVFCGAESFGLFSPHLSNKFSSHGNGMLREIFGRPRRAMGTILLLSRFPIIVSAAARGDTTTLIPFIAWSLGDLAFSLSQEEAAKKRA
jgi:hypothetical protein